MLQELFIRNFTIIGDLHICFSDGLTILSGETGAGKSIIINAVNLLLGSRASAEFIRTGEGTAELEVLFQIAPDSRVADILKTHEYDISEGLVIRRIISRNNRHRIYVNGHITTMKLLNAITENLASISGQHAHQLLLREDQHLMILDQFGDLMPMREKVRTSYQDILPMIRKLGKLRSLKARQAEQIEMLEFQRDEILEASLVPDEDTALEREKAILRNGETLYRAVYGGIEELYNAQDAIVERLVDVKKQLERACQIDPELSPKVQEIDNTTFQIEDIVDGLRAYLDNIQTDAHRLEEIEFRLDTLQRMKRKYGGSLEAVMSHLESVEETLSGFENLSDQITEAEEGLAERNASLVRLATELSQKRKDVGEILARKVEVELGTLKMSQTRFRIALDPIPADENTDPYLTWTISDGDEKQTCAIHETGMDKAIFLIAPNVGEALKPLANIASGGELSRVVLALKAILVQTESVETVIFDEVDAGIGGSTAEIVGRKLASLADYHQVVCITHLPQIAKFGKHHFRISKHVDSGRTHTVIEPLKEDERVKEIARMLGGVTMTQVTLDHAFEMLQNK